MTTISSFLIIASLVGLLLIRCARSIAAVKRRQVHNEAIAAQLQQMESSFDEAEREYRRERRREHANLASKKAANRNRPGENAPKENTSREKTPDTKTAENLHPKPAKKALTFAEYEATSKSLPELPNYRPSASLLSALNSLESKRMATKRDNTPPPNSIPALPPPAEIKMRQPPVRALVTLCLAPAKLAARCLWILAKAAAKPVVKPLEPITSRFYWNFFARRKFSPRPSEPPRETLSETLNERNRAA